MMHTSVLSVKCLVLLLSAVTSANSQPDVSLNPSRKPAVFGFELSPITIQLALKYHDGKNKRNKNS